MPADPEASLRENLHRQIASAQADIEANLDTLTRAAGAGNELPLIQAQSQLQGLSRLQQRLAEARGGDLAAIRAEITASIAATQLLVQQSRVAAATQTAEAVLREARQALRDEVTSLVEDFYDKKKFDKYLSFRSADEEVEYRKREAQRRQLIEEELAKGTPQGDLAAAKVMDAQMKDAGAYGADASPEFKQDQADLAAATARLKGALRPSAEAAQGIDSDLDALDGPQASRIALADQSKDGHGLAVSRPGSTPSGARSA